MSNRILTVFLVVVLIWGAYALFEYWETYRTNTRPHEPTNQVANPVPPGMDSFPPMMENDYANAEHQGAVGLKRFLTKYADAPALKDPRKAWIQLDYVTLAALTDTAEAKRVYREVRGRIGPDSPVYPRVKKLQPNFE
ncbi:MAG: hypothetical protein WCO56_12210 [Verrucomicrobiota bacterium]